MKHLLMIFSLFVFTLSSIGQKDKVVSETFKVYGNCDMCKERIENAVDVIGVKRASWNTETEMLAITFNSTKITGQEIHQLCADIGHATAKLKANEEAYEGLHHCCKYVIHEHENGEHNESGHENVKKEDAGECKEHKGCTNAKCSSE